MFLVKLKRLYDSAELIAGRFGTALRPDFDAAWLAVETAVATKTWTDIRTVVNDAENLFTDFLTTWTGSQDEVKTFLAALRDLFAK